MQRRAISSPLTSAYVKPFCEHWHPLKRLMGQSLIASRSSLDVASLLLRPHAVEGRDDPIGHIMCLLGIAYQILA